MHLCLIKHLSLLLSLSLLNSIINQSDELTSDLYAKSFYCSSILIWNEIMNKIEVSISFPQFKILLKHYLLVNSLKK